jgi:ClpP class serine protease
MNLPMEVRQGIGALALFGLTDALIIRDSIKVFAEAERIIFTNSIEFKNISELFIKTVARNRGIDPQVVRNTQAGLLFGENAVTSGMADSIMPYAKLMNDLQEKILIDRVRNTPVIK